jgi:hypothetical protein
MMTLKWKGDDGHVGTGSTQFWEAQDEQKKTLIPNVFLKH